MHHKKLKFLKLKKNSLNDTIVLLCQFKGFVFAFFKYLQAQLQSLEITKIYYVMYVPIYVFQKNVKPKVCKKVSSTMYEQFLIRIPESVNLL